MTEFMTLTGQSVSRVAAEDRPTIIALHCTASSGRQWRTLIERASGAAKVIAPDIEALPLAGHPDVLDHVANAVIHLMQDIKRPVHLVGHSYGAALALRTALKIPGRVAGLYLYEPTSFGLLKHCGFVGARAQCEITALASAIEALIGIKRHDDAMRAFVDYWQGAGSWMAMPPDIRARFALRVPRVPQDFRALFADPMTPQQLQSLSVPTVIVRGGETALPTRVLAEAIAGWLPDAQAAVIPEAGHMGPVTHADRVAEVLFEAITATSEATRPPAPHETHGPEREICARPGQAAGRSFARPE